MLRSLRHSLVIALILLGAATSDKAPTPAEKAVPRAHAHNDYEHAHPLFDALSNGFTSVEADVWLVDGQLRVSHNKRSDWSKAGTLQELYLTPLAKLRAERGGHVYADAAPLALLIDIKTESEPTYRVLDAILAKYAAENTGFLTEFAKKGDGGYEVRRGEVTVIVSGDRPRELMQTQARRFAGYDGRIDDIGKGEAAEFMPWISDNWNTVFHGPTAWSGSGAPSPAAEGALKKLVADVHREGKMLRLWNLPIDGPAVWAPLRTAGVDWINTDRLAELAGFLNGPEEGGAARN